MYICFNYFFPQEALGEITAEGTQPGSNFGETPFKAWYPTVQCLGKMHPGDLSVLPALG